MRAAKRVIRRSLSSTRQRQLSRLLQTILLGIFMFGVYTGEPKTIINAGIGLVITFLPAILERNYRVPLNPFLGLWVTGAIFLHTLGSAGLYGYLGWWDHLTHAFSASIVAAIGFIVVRSITVHSDDIHLPRRFYFVYIIVFVIAFGVIWELFEFGLDILAEETGITMPLAQHGLDDTVRDLMFNTLGAVVVAIWGQAYLSNVTETIWNERGGRERESESAD